MHAGGSPNGSDYEDEPESGKTGYYYYDTFTVSTTFDTDGNELYPAYGKGEINI